MQYTQAQIDRANAASLEDFLRTQGETLIKSGREYRWKEHDSLTVRGNKWFRHSQSKGGYPIDFVMEFYGKSFPEAVQLLTGESAEGQSEASTAPPTAFHLPLHNRTADRAIQYLCESRGLNKTLVEAFLLSGDIYEDAKRHNVVFVGRDRSGTPRYAHVRGTADPFRQDIAGSDKSYPFHYEGNGNQLFVFEAPIDLLSFICLYPQDWQTRSYLALGGVSGKALDRFLSERKDTRKVFLCLDSDTAGSEACTRLAQSIPGEIAVIRLVPARKDWNDVLRQQGDIPSRKFIAETITLRELPTAQPVPMLRMADVELTSVDWLWFPYIPFGKLTIIQGNPGEGKTYFAMRLAAACTNRKPLPGMETLEPFNIIYQTAEDGLGYANLSKYAFLVIVNITLLFIGMFMEGSAPILILSPLLMPVAISLGIDPIHFGLVFIFNIGIGNMTPPFGGVLYQVAGLLNIPIGRLAKAAMPFIGIMIFILILLTFIPELSLLVPNLVYN